MRRCLATWMALVLAALATLAAPAAGAAAEDGNTRAALIKCEQQDFSTACPEGLTWDKLSSVAEPWKIRKASSSEKSSGLQMKKIIFRYKGEAEEPLFS